MSDSAVMSAVMMSSAAVALANDAICTTKEFTKTLDFFQETLGSDVVLAGGCIRDTWIGSPLLVKDIDVWVLGVTDETMLGLDEKLQASLDGVDHTLRPSPRYPIGPYHAPRGNFRLPWVPASIPTQVMFSRCTSMQELVGQFDWHVCEFGFDGKTVISSGVSDFLSGTLTLNPDNALRSARSTLRRGFHLEDKYRGTAYRLKMPNETILSLAAMLTLSAEKR